jgi:hypothetical protein
MTRNKPKQSSGVFIADAQSKIVRLARQAPATCLTAISTKTLTKPTYKAKQAELMSRKKSLEEQIGKLTLAANAWVEPMRQWLKQAYDLNRIAKNAEPSAVKAGFSLKLKD